MWHVCIQRSTLGEGVSQRRCHPEGGQWHRQKGREKARYQEWLPKGGAASGLTKRALDLFCLKLLVHRWGAFGTLAMPTKMHGLDSVFKHTKISHLYSQILTKLENCKSAHILGTEEKWRAMGTKLPVPMLSERHYFRLYVHRKSACVTAGGMSLSVKFTVMHNNHDCIFQDCTLN